jgi:hypothetical protein
MRLGSRQTFASRLAGVNVTGGPAMPNRRTMELVIVTVVLLHPVIRMARIWAFKHQATSSNPATSTAAEVIATLA